MRRRGIYSWVDIEGKRVDAPRDLAPRPDDVLAGICQPDFIGLRFRDPDAFVAGSRHGCEEAWGPVLTECPGTGDRVKEWLREGVDLYDFFQPYQVTYRGRVFDSAVPPDMYFPNAPVCRQFVPFINDTITKRLVEGSVELLGPVKETAPPRCVNALSVEPSKPRLVLSMKGPNLWCKDTPFKLVPLGDIVKPINRVRTMPRVISRFSSRTGPKHFVDSSGQGFILLIRPCRSALKIVHMFILLWVSVFQRG